MKFLSWIIKTSTWLFRLFYLLLAVAAILVAAYALGGYEFLARGGWGSDLRSALSMLAWVDKYFPNVPFWYPLAGGGVSITHSYPVFSFYLVAILKRVSDLNLIQAFGVLGISSVFLMALGIYGFVALRFKNQTAALIASLFYLVSPIAWVWLFDWGFYAEAVSHMFVAPAIIFWDLFFTSFIEGMEKFRNRIYLALAVACLSLAILTHFGTGFALMGFFGFYILGYTIREKERKKVFARGLLALSLVGSLALAATALTTLPFYRYTKIAAESGLTGLLSYGQVKESDLPISQVLSLQPAITELGHPSPKRHISFPTVVSFFAVLGVLLSLQSVRSFTLALFAIFALVLSTNVGFMFWIVRHVPWPFHTPFGWRFTFIALRVVLPTLAALGAIWIFKVPFFWARGKISGFIKGAFASLAGLILVGFALYQFGYLPKPEGRPLNYGARGFDPRNIWSEPKLIRLPDVTKEDGYVDVEVAADDCMKENTCGYMEDEECLAGFEEEGEAEWCRSPLRPYFLPLAVYGWCNWLTGSGGDHELCHPSELTEEQVKAFWQECREAQGFSNPCGIRFESLEEQILPAGWPEFKIAGGLNPSEWFGQVLERISAENPSARLDFSPYSPGLAMPAPYFNLDRNLSQIYIYAADSSLIRRFWGQEISAFYLEDPFYGKDPDLVANWTRWFGLNYLFFETSTDTRFLREAGWEPWVSSYTDEGVLTGGALKFSEENPLADLSEKPAVLVIGQNNVDAYGQVFRLASYGALPYEDAFIIWGKGTLDRYSVEELKNFDALALHGYAYSNPQKVSKTLADYVRQGGKVFIDTGWQYTVPDWESDDPLDIIPLKKLSWKNLGKASDYSLEDFEIGGTLDLSQFGPLDYQGEPWSVSTSEKSDLRTGAQVILSVNDYPLVAAYKLGEGRVVWSGMNLFAHAKQKEALYREEVTLLKNLFAWLNEDSLVENFSVTYQRDHPDKVEFTVEEDVPNGGFLLWKEAYHPDFKASLVTSNESPVTNLPIYRAGPGWALIKVPELKEGEKIVYEYKTPLVEKASSALSFLTLFFLIPLYLAEGILLREKSLALRLFTKLEEKLHFIFFELPRKPLDWWGKKDEDAE